MATTNTNIRTEIIRKIVGINDDASDCCCCGKQNLKRVVWISEDDGEPAHYGTTCAARLMGFSGNYAGKHGGSKLQRDITRRDEQRAKRAATTAQAQRLADTYGRPWAVVRVSRYGQYGGYTRYITTKDAAVFVDGDSFYPSNKEELRKLEVVYPR